MGNIPLAQYTVGKIKALDTGRKYHRHKILLAKFAIGMKPLAEITIGRKYHWQKLPLAKNIIGAIILAEYTNNKNYDTYTTRYQLK